MDPNEAVTDVRRLQAAASQGWLWCEQPKIIHGLNRETVTTFLYRCKVCTTCLVYKLREEEELAIRRLISLHRVELHKAMDKKQLNALRMKISRCALSREIEEEEAALVSHESAHSEPERASYVVLHMEEGNYTIFTDATLKGGVEIPEHRVFAGGLEPLWNPSKQLSVDTSAIFLRVKATGRAVTYSRNFPTKAVENSKPRKFQKVIYADCRISEVEAIYKDYGFPYQHDTKQGNTIIRTLLEDTTFSKDTIKQLG